MTSKPNAGGWSLEVVRGRDLGRVFALEPGEVILGQSPPGRAGIDLSAQEGTGSTRKLAARHALVDSSIGGLAVRDLETEAGTFVNRQRVLPGKTRPLQPGDVIQLGSVHLKVVENRSAPAPAPAPAPPPATASPPSSPFSYPIPGGPTCRSWDEILTASAQRWEALRDELVSGRLASFLASIGRGDLAPRPDPSGSPDDRLDLWLGSIPTTRAARPELEVHPARLVVRVTPGGGVTRRSVQVANVGHRLLRSTARVEPSGLTWLAVAKEFAGRDFTTIEGTELPVEIQIPERLDAPQHATLVIEGNGGSARVSVVLEARSTTSSPDLAASPNAGRKSGPTLGELIARQSPARRLVSWGLIAVAIRFVVGVVSGAIGEDTVRPSTLDSPGLAPVACLFAGVGALVGGILATRAGGRLEAPSGGFAGACLGLVGASAVVAACRTFEPALGSWSTSIVAVGLTWLLLGSGLAAVSILSGRGKP